MLRLVFFQEMNFRVFALIVIGMCIIGISLGYVLGFYFRNAYDSNYWAYLAVQRPGITVPRKKHLKPYIDNVC